MKVYRTRARTDDNQVDIAATLRGVGASVFYIRWPFDLLVGFRGDLYLLECKLPGEHLNANQKSSLLLLELADCMAVVVYSPEEALAAIGAIDERRPEDQADSQETRAHPQVAAQGPKP